ncbi:hypothetical protein [Nonomuraea sp. bgisy101]
MNITDILAALTAARAEDDHDTARALEDDYDAEMARIEAILADCTRDDA